MIREKLLPTTDTANNLAVPFVDMTICPDYNVAYKKVALQTLGLDKHMYSFKGVYVNLTKNEVDDPQVIYDSITYDVEDVLSSMTFSTSRNYVKIEFNKNNSYDDIQITTGHIPFYGKCYSIHPSTHLIEQSIQKISIVSHIDTIVYFGYPGQFMHPNTKTKVFPFVLFASNFMKTL